METNETELETLETSEDTTLNTEEKTPDDQIKSLNEQKKHWREKAEGYKKQLDEIKSKVSPEPELKKPNEPDYAKLAYLKSEGVDNPDDRQILIDEAERLKLPLTDVIQMEHMKTKLEANKADRLAKQGLPAGTKRTGGYTQHDVEYYLQNPDLRPEDHELAIKVLNAKIATQKRENMFSDQMFTG